jgi:hypothetical protein
VLKKNQEMIKQANALQKKLTKSLEKFRGDPISSDKEYEEIAGIVRRYQELLGKKEDLPDSKEGLLSYAEGLEREYAEANGKCMEPTFFMRTKDGKIQISNHMVLGNLKENLKICTNNNTTDKKDKVLPSKVAVGEVMALDVKPVEEFSTATKDILRQEDNSPQLCVRPLRFQGQHGIETALSASEILPVGTEFEMHLRVRKDSPLNKDGGAPIVDLLDLGKSNGLGQWRGSGCKGQFCFQFDPVDYDPSGIPEGWR